MNNGDKLYECDWCGQTHTFNEWHSFTPKWVCYKCHMDKFSEVEEKRGDIKREDIKREDIISSDFDETLANGQVSRAVIAAVLIFVVILGIYLTTGVCK